MRSFDALFAIALGLRRQFFQPLARLFALRNGARTASPVRPLLFEQEESRFCLAGWVFLTPSSLSILENGTGSVTVNVMGQFSGSLIVNYQTNAVTATSGDDYTPRSGSVTLTQANPFAQIPLDALADSLTESPETYDLALLSVIGDGTLGTPATAQITIDDSTPAGGGGGQPTGLTVEPPGTLNEGATFNLHAAVTPPGIYSI